MRKLFDDELDDMKKLVLSEEPPITHLGRAFEMNEYAFLKMYINEEYSNILSVVLNLCEAELHRMTSEAILWRE